MNYKLKPFVKWAGGKKQLLGEINNYYPFENSKIYKYAEPFVGGGAVLFDILNKYDIKEIYISDTNVALINSYNVIKNSVESLIDILSVFQKEYLSLNNDERKDYYLKKRSAFNECINDSSIENIKKAALFIFLNKTCFNGLYRVNRKGYFNVPIGSYKKPLICDKSNLINISKSLNNVNIVCGDYTLSENFIDDSTFVYFDPPYRPLNDTSNFTSYSSEGFDDNEQIRLAEFTEKLRKKGAKILISNSDPKNIDINDNFFEDLYINQKIKRVDANRFINSNSKARGKIKELLISNCLVR